MLSQGAQIYPATGLVNTELSKFRTKLRMKTLIDIDDALMQEALQLSGLPSKKATVEYALELLIKLKRQMKFKEFKGKLQWEGDLDETRRDH